MARFTYRSTFAALGIFALLVAACGNSSKSSSSSSGQTGTTVAGNQFANLQKIAPPNPCVNDPGITDSEIKVGLIAPQTGPQAASFSDAINGFKARVDKANSSGELGSRKVNVVVRDDAADQTKNIQQVRDLVENSKVWAVAEVTSASGGPGADYLHSNNVPVVGWHVGIPDWSKDANMFTFRLPTAADPDHVYNDRDATIMKNQGVTKVALIGGGNAQSVDFLTRNKQAFKVVNLPVVYDNESVPPGTTDFTAEAQAIKDSGADGLLTGMDFIPNTNLSAQLSKDGVTMKELQFPGGYDPRVLGLPGMEGAFFGLEFKPFESNPPAYQAFNTAMPKGAVRNQVSYIGWLSGEILMQGIKDAGISCPTRKALINNLRMETDYTGGGAFDPVNLETGFGQEFACAYYVKVVNKQFVPQFGGKQQCGKPIHF